MKKSLTDYQKRYIEQKHLPKGAKVIAVFVVEKFYYQRKNSKDNSKWIVVKFSLNGVFQRAKFSHNNNQYIKF